MGCCFGSDVSRKNRPSDNDILGRRKDVTCTDPICCILFVIFIIGMAALTAYAYVEGDIRRVTNNHDCFGNICGKENNEKLFPDNPNSGINTSTLPYVFHTFSEFWPVGRTICVSKCPDKFLKTYSDVKEYAIINGSKLCDYNVAINEIDSKNHMANLNIATYHKSQCAILPVKPQIDLLGFCIQTKIPKKSRIRNFEQLNFISTDFNSNLDKIKPIFESIVRDFVVTWPEILCLSVVSLGLSLILVILIRFLAWAVVYLILLLTVIATIGVSTFLWLCYASQQNVLSIELVDQLRFLIGDVINTKSFILMAIVSTVITVIIHLVIIFMWKRIKIVTKLFNEASNCIGQIPSILIMPLITFILLSSFLFYWFVTFGFLMSVAGYKVNNRTGCVDYITASFPKYTWIYFVVGLVWISEFILATQQMVIAGVVAQWYFLKSKSGRTVNCALCKSWMRFIFQHSGSAAFGSLIITAVRLPRWFLMYLMKKFKKMSSDSPETCCIKCLTSCCAGCLYCLEKCLQYLNKNAYAIIAIEGTPFCTSAIRAFQLVVANFLRVAALNSIGDFILLLGKLCVSFLSAAGAIFVFMRRTDLYFYVVPVFVVALIAFFFAHCVLSLYETVLDVLLICYCVDEEDKQRIDGAGDQADAPLEPKLTPSKSHTELKTNLQKANYKLNKISGKINQPTESGDIEQKV